MDPFAPFQAGKCVLCGECLQQCPVMQLPKQTAIAESARLRNGEPSWIAVKRCQSCLACNFICPQQANPAQRILARWDEAIRRDGLPERARFYTMDAPVNFRTYVLSRLPADEQALVASWAAETPCDEIFYPGCNIILTPYLTRSRLFDGQNIRGSLELCCGEMYFRTGQTKMLEKTAKRLTAWSRRLGFKRMTIACTAGANLFANVLPRHGAQFEFEVRPLLPLLLARVERGDFAVRQPLNMTVTLQDSCHAKFHGAAYEDAPRQLLEKIGVKVIEQAHCRERGLCCGIGGGFSQPSAYHPLDVTRAAVRALREAKRSGAPALAVYCAGCLQMLAVGQIAWPNRMPIYHVLELLQLAIGENPPRPHKRRALTMFAGVARHQFPTLLSRGRFSPVNLRPEQ
jgi:Fe-S oxidoreductase